LKTYSGEPTLGRLFPNISPDYTTTVALGKTPALLWNINHTMLLSLLIMSASVLEFDVTNLLSPT
jgi:hypothetical protein